MPEPVVITCAITGGMTVPSQSPHIPITAAEIAKSAVEAHDAGAAVIHIHVREDDGRPTSRPELFREVYETIISSCDAVVMPTTGGGAGMSIAERAQVVPQLRPEMATLNMGSFNFGIFRAAERISHWEYEWEREYLEGTREYVFRNTFRDVEFMCYLMREQSTKPGLEVYDVGHLYNIVYFLETGLLEPPPQIQFVLGVLGASGAHAEELMHLTERARTLIGEHTWSVAGIGYRGQFQLATMALLLGGNVRVGLEDNLRLTPEKVGDIKC